MADPRIDRRRRHVLEAVRKFRVSILPRLRGQTQTPNLTTEARKYGDTEFADMFLIDVMTIAILAVICGADGWVAVVEFGKAKHDCQ